MSTLIARHNNGDFADVEVDFVRVTLLLPNRKSKPVGDATFCIAGRDTRDKHANEKIGSPLIAFVAGFFATPIFALEVTESAGAAHGYPGYRDINGKKLAHAEFSMGGR